MKLSKYRVAACVTYAAVVVVVVAAVIGNLALASGAMFVAIISTGFIVTVSAVEESNDAK